MCELNNCQNHVCIVYTCYLHKLNYKNCFSTKEVMYFQFFKAPECVAELVIEVVSWQCHIASYNL